MRLLRKNIIYGFLAVTGIILLYSCEKDTASTTDWGIVQVYMPQASVLNGGETNEYPVPLDAPYKNYSVDTVVNIIKIPLGVSRSGLESLEGYKVEVEADITSTNSLLAEGSIQNGVLLPNEVYNLPEEVTVLSGEREAIFNLTIDRAKLIENYPDYNSKKMVLIVNIISSSQYEINPNLSSTTIIIDAKNFIPAPPVENLIKGGDMEASSEDFWTVMGSSLNIEFGYTEDLPTGSSGGSLKLYADEDVNGTIYQEVQVEPGQNYQLSAKIKVPGGGHQFWFLFMVSDIIPGTGDWSEANNAFMGVNTWWGCGENYMDGDIRDVGCEGQGHFGDGIASNGIFTATESTMYVAIQLGKWEGTFGGNILVDDVELIKVD